MKNKKGNIAVIAVIIVIVAITAGVIGFMFAKKTAAPTVPVAVIQQPANPAPAAQPTDETANWQIFTNGKMGIEFKYPPEKIGIGDVSVEKNDKAVSVSLFPIDKNAATSTAVNIGGASVYKVNSLSWIYKNLQEYLDKIENESRLIPIKQTSPITGITWDCIWNYTPDKVKTKNCYNQSGDNIYELSFYLNEKMQYFTEKDFDKVLSTFKFTDVADEANYFLIPEAGIKFKVPVSLKDDLVYTFENGTSGQVIGLSTKTLIHEGGAGCSTNALGNLVKIYGDYTKDVKYTKPGKDVPWWETTNGLRESGAVQLNGFFVWFQSPQAVCADIAEKDMPAFENILSTQGEALSQSIKNIELIK